MSWHAKCPTNSTCQLAQHNNFVQKAATNCPTALRVTETLCRCMLQLSRHQSIWQHFFHLFFIFHFFAAFYRLFVLPAIFQRWHFSCCTVWLQQHTHTYKNMLVQTANGNICWQQQRACGKLFNVYVCVGGIWLNLEIGHSKIQAAKSVAVAVANIFFCFCCAIFLIYFF